MIQHEEGERFQNNRLFLPKLTAFRRMFNFDYQECN